MMTPTDYFAHGIDRRRDIFTIKVNIREPAVAEGSNTHTPKAPGKTDGQGADDGIESAGSQPAKEVTFSVRNQGQFPCRFQFAR